MSKTLSQVSIYGLYDPRDGVLRYIGKTVQPLHRRLMAHLCDKFDSHKSRWVQSLVRDNLKPEIRLLELSDSQDWIDCEKFWISVSRLAGFNLTNSVEGGQGGTNPTPETIRKMSLAKIGKKQPAEAISKRMEAFKKVVRTEEWKRNIALGNKGKVMSQESRLKMSLAKKGKRPWNYGKKLSDEYRNKLSISHLGFRPTEEARKKLSLRTKEGWENLEIRSKRLKGLRAKSATQEYRDKMSVIMKGIKSKI
jgi:hypothetical protein